MTLKQLLLRYPGLHDILYAFRPCLAATNRVFSIDFLQVNKSLQTIDLKENDIGDEGAEALAEALKVVLGAQILIFWLETCCLFALFVIPQPFYRCRNLCGPRHKLIFLTLLRILSTSFHVF